MKKDLKVEECPLNVQITKDMDAVGEILEKAKNVKLPNGKTVDLSVEVVCWALKYMKENPTISIEQAMFFGFNEWDK